MEQIMNQTDVKVSFYLKKSGADAKGNCPVMARLIVGKYSETAFSVKENPNYEITIVGKARRQTLRNLQNSLDMKSTFVNPTLQKGIKEVILEEPLTKRYI